MINNQKYISVLDIYAKLSRKHKNKSWNYDDILEWCAEVETDFIGDPKGMSRFLEIELEVSSLKAYLPCNIYRILDVYTEKGDSKSREPFNNSGSYINFNSNYKKDYIYIDYLGVTVDKEGEPLILKGHEQACEAYCLANAYYEDFLIGKLPSDRWMYLSEDWKNKVEASKSDYRHWTRQDYNDMQIILGNYIPRIGNIKLSKYKFG